MCIIRTSSLHKDFNVSESNIHTCIFHFIIRLQVAGLAVSSSSPLFKSENIAPHPRGPWSGQCKSASGFKLDPVSQYVVITYAVKYLK